MEEANKLIGTGKKHLVMGKVVEAVSSLQEACGMLAKKYGDTADECGEAFYWCGKALLDLARMENSVLGNALEGVPEGEEDEEKPKDSNVDGTENIDEKTRDELRVQVYDAMAEKKDEEKKDSDKEDGKESEDKEKNGDVEKAEAGDEEQKEEKAEEEKKNEPGSKSESEEKTEKDKEAEEQTEDKEEEAGDGEEEEEEDGEDAEMDCDGEEQGEGEGDGPAEKDSDDEDEVGNLQLAWEMLEVAKVIYKRKEAKEDQLMAAQTHLKLGEVSVESGNYTQALEDFQECLKLQVKHLDSDSRLLAETHYHLGVTYSLNMQYTQAIKSLQSSINAIKSRLDKLKELLDKAEGPEALPDERKEMEELKALLPEIQEKVEDATEAQKTASTAAEAMKGVLDGGSTSSAFPGTAVENTDTSPNAKINGTTNGVSSTNGHTSKAPVSDISHLVRKKRKPEESPVKEGVVKKVKQDADQTNGEQEAHTNGDTNGHAAEVKSQ
ncbi:histone-binding protein N1/N2-like [Cheilinus undulatus]|uniref:histone-binding protein N1/N2-like n=1 Tax=Cheilinus undulatus TaxID=241271 RepID=UPI001BD48109|nr:histone-binding protein N1/N2-like [Cheilinus undulatus]